MGIWLKGLCMVGISGVVNGMKMCREMRHINLLLKV
jgi:hypothetical protein